MVGSVYISRMIPAIGVSMLAKAGLDVRLNPRAAEPRAEDLMEAAGRHEAFICQLSDRIDRAFLKAAAPRCKIVATCAVGVDNIDLTAARELGVMITNTPDVLTHATADLAFGLLLAAARRLGEAERVVRSGAWRGWAMLDFLGADVYGKTLGIIGAGRIGTAMAARSRGFEMPLLYCARKPNAQIEAWGGRRESLYTVLEQSDFISLHVPLTEDTRLMLDSRAFEYIKPGAILINTARGAVVDQAEMIKALQSGRLAAAGLDVYENEPAVSPELMAMENVVLLPHIGSATTTTRDRMAQIAAGNVVEVVAGRPPLNPVG